MKSPLERRVAGATVSHWSPFIDLEVPTSDDGLPKEMVTKWVVPLYLRLWNAETVPVVKSLYGDINPVVVSTLLADSNWRPRVVGAFLIAIKRYSDFTDQIGRLLLRSDTCFSGKVYCFALARLNSADAVAYLKRYLEYYLTRDDLDYDQDSAMAALAYLDRANGTGHIQELIPQWNLFVGEQRKAGLHLLLDEFSSRMEQLRRLEAECSDAN